MVREPSEAAIAKMAQKNPALLAAVGEALTKSGEKVMAFETLPNKETRKLLAWLGIKAVLKKPDDVDRRKEILVGGMPPANRIQGILPQLVSGSQVEQLNPQPDGTQQLWTCGDFSVRGVFATEELVAELKKGRHALCVLEDQNMIVQTNMQEYLKLRDKARKSASFKFEKPLGHSPVELLPKLVAISPSTKYVITCHVRGHGVSRENRIRYLKFPQVVKIVGWLDSASHKQYLLNLIRKLYA